MFFEDFIIGALSNESAIEVLSMKQRSFTSKITVQNHTKYTIEGLLIQHQSYNDETNPNMAILTNLKPGRSVSCDWTFETKGPSIATKIVASLFSLGLSNIGTSWGKDYWMLTLKTNHSSKQVTTNNSHILTFNLSEDGDKWFANIEHMDKSISLIIRYDEGSALFQAAINRNNTNGQSTRFFRQSKYNI